MPDHAQIRQRRKTVRFELLGLLAHKFLLKLVRARSTAKVIGLPTDIFRDRYSPWNKHQTLGILNHLILAGGKTFRLPLAFKPSNCSPNKEVQDDEQPENKENSIHSGICFLAPQSYGTGPPLSRTPNRTLPADHNEVSYKHQAQTAQRHLSKRTISPSDPVLQMDMLLFLIMIQCRYDNL